MTTLSLQTEASPVTSASTVFITQQRDIIEAHAKILKDAGRMPKDFSSPERVLGQYGWHSSVGSSAGARAPVELLRRTVTGGAFGAYSFHQPAFEQAKRAWWIHGVMEAGSDILVPVNRNARFTTRCDFWASSDGSHSAPCVNTMENPVGYRVQYISAYPHGEIRNATVIEIPKHPDGSSTNTLRLDRKAPGFAMTYDIGILPPDWIDMCDCSL